MRQMRSKPETKAAEAKFSAGVKQRDGYVCRMQYQVAPGGAWLEHGIKGSPINPLDASHIYKRDDCGKAKFMLEVGITSCRRCHELYGMYDRTVRVPPARESAAYVTIVANSKLAPPRRLPEGVLNHDVIR